MLSRTASVAFVTIMGRPMATSQDFVNWVCGPDLEPWFLVYLLMAARDYIRKIASGAVHKTVYMPTVKAFRVCMPHVIEQRRIIAHVREQMASADRLEQLANAIRNSLEHLPPILLRQAFNGGV